MNLIPFPFLLDIKKNQHLISFSQDEIWGIINKVIESLYEEYPLYENFAMSINNELIDNAKDILRQGDLRSFKTFLESINQICGDNFVIYFSGWNKKEKNDAIRRFENLIKERYQLDQDVLEKIDFELFMGKYETTYGGIHREFCSNIQYVFYGKKSFLVWPPEYFENYKMKEKNQKDTNYQKEDYLLEKTSEEDITNGIILNGYPDNAFQWWHVGISPDLSASMTLAFYD
ncbi:cupin-like domain-containing protein [Aquimarina sp. RZ0]|uniref:cupin-like domain-containing protein n=1 Tax=Aquimarina sp. RZ0 TaxID=2607730 RepID=UPI0011F1855D|nr:cupin-like domain-containing protein [Aquimarina sp. RZ0]KAA1243803.1 hypothetical protein F0000_19420 [Aquimarina sp. RZ0]